MNTLILADDLSGGTDCAAATRRSALVVLSGKAPAGEAIIALDLDSRHRDPLAAVRQVRDALGGAEARPDIVYQKMDSTLRGNWIAELGAIHATLSSWRGSPQLAVLCPAFPENGRTVEAGRLVLAGMGVAVPEANLEAYLVRAGLPYARLPDASSTEILRSRLVGLARSGIAVALCDATTRADLDRLAAASLPLRTSVFWVGSAGLMGSLAGHLPGRDDRRPRLVPEGTPVLAVVGSASPLARQQFEALAAARGVHSFTVQPADLLNPDKHAAASIAASIAEAMPGARCVSIAIASDTPGTVPDGTALTAGLARLLAPHLPGFGGFILTGGETARAVLSLAGVRAIRVLGEVETGVPLGETIGDLERPLVTKAGAFGTADTLRRALSALTGRTVDHEEST